MHQQKTDIAVLGAGFAGSLIALILKQIGLQVLLIEKSKHPRFAIGESSTPLANLHLEAICEQYNLPKIRPLCKYGSWQKHYPQIACGLKRGFSYFKHDENVAFAHSPDHGNELLVAASPNDEVSDTQWFREHVDLLFLQEAQAAEVEYWPETSVIKMAQSETGWRLECEKKDGHVRVDAAFLLDATGSGALVADALNIPSIVQNIKTRSWSVFSHFRDVRLWHDELEKAGGLVADHPFHCDHAALHHIFDDGWMWLLRFNNDVTSAGFAFAGEAPAIYNQPEAFWQFKIRHFPSIAAQFSAASAVQPFFFAPRLQRCWQQSAGSNWAMLPHAAYFLDPLYSAGIAHTLLGLRRLAAIIEGHWQCGSLAAELRKYSTLLQSEIAFLDQLIHGSYLAFRQFELFTAFSMLYFAGAIFSEHAHRQGEQSPLRGFLFSDHPSFRHDANAAYNKLVSLMAQRGQTTREIEAFSQQIADAIAPFNIAGLCHPEKKNMYPYV
ncbi:MAG: tryptophan 7-halogenase [Deferribacteres bacterium]|nr:tryptophan 7-halogenase [candidate division KSB1 bacterium]MCB9510813.1 tryptophan 7-halogenase [Deferribacteres bacterium]